MKLDSRLGAFVLGLLLAVPCVRAEEPKTAPPPAADKEGWRPLFNGKNLDGWKSTEFGGEGAVKVENGQLIIGQGEPMTGVTFQKPALLLKDRYEIRLEAMRVQGDDFFCGLTIPVRDSHCSLICGGWGGSLVGISSLDGFDASENETTHVQKFEQKKWYKLRVRVDGKKLDAWIDDKQVVECDIMDRKLSTRIEVELSHPLGVCTYRTQAAIRNFEMRPLPEKK